VALLVLAITLAASPWVSVRRVTVSVVTATDEVVFVVSNAAVRDAVARTCAELGVPWYGPTFDS
jgi:hypothetical protein